MSISSDFLSYTSQCRCVQRDGAHLLQLLNLPQYVTSFTRQGYVSLRSVLELSWEDLEDLGVTKLGTTPSTKATFT